MNNSKKYSWFRDLVVYSITTIRSTITYRDISILNDLKYFSKWRKFRISKSGTLEHGIPWLVFTCIKFLNNYLKKEMVVFEYGSGGSTEFIRHKVIQLYSIEHDEEWYNQVKKHFDETGASNVKLDLKLPQVDDMYSSKSPNNPEDCISSRLEYKGKSFEDYVKTIYSFPDNYFDLIIVDGRARISCISASLDKLKTGGVLLVDNANRPSYLKPFPGLKDKTSWKLKKFTGHFPFSSASIVNQTFAFQKLK